MGNEPLKVAAGRAVRKVIVLYNCDYDPVPPPPGVAGRDRSEVARAAFDVRDAITNFGFQAEILGVEGRDIAQCVETVRRLSPDLVFNLTESLAQDSTNEIVMPAVLEMLGIPYTGSGSMALGLCLHKPKAKDILRSRGVPTPASCTVERAKDAAGVDLPYPLFVKLSREDASVGIKDENVVWNRRALVKRVRALLDEFEQPVLIERYVEGREVYVTLLGNDPLVPLPFHEIDFSLMPSGRPKIVSYAAKWDESSPEYAGTTPVPVRDLPESWRQSIERTAIAAFRALELRDYGRVDFRVADDGTPYVIDVNPNCDISPGAGVARAARAAGMSFPQLIGRICEIAWERHLHAHQKARAA
ncbi:MAG: ATP-grasp domain-containing protein [Deltaproteobacteria bacterium]|nr:ATP-grasp domain-containing protein [Deltaproteobacteria bacterium]